MSKQTELAQVADTITVNSGNVGIGTSSPATALDVTGTVTADGLTVDNNTVSFNGTADQNLNLYTSNVGADNRINFGDANDADVGRIYYQHNGNHMLFYTNATERLKLHGNGDISFYEDTGTTPKFFWDASAESLGIGKTDRTNVSVLTVQNVSDVSTNTAEFYNDNGNRTFRFAQDTSGNADLLLEKNDGTDTVLISTHGDSYFNGGNVGIGTSSPSHSLQINGSDNAVNFRVGDASGNNSLRIYNNTTSNAVALDASDSATNMQFAISGTERMRIDSAGRVTKPYQPHFQAKCPSTSSYQKSGSDDTLSDSMSVAGRNVGSHYNTSTGIFTAPVTGNYMFTATVRWETGSFTQNSYIRLFISVNNGSWDSGYGHQINGTNEAYSNYTPMSVSSVIYLAGGDNVRLKGGLHNGTSVLFRESYFTGMLIG